MCEWWRYDKPKLTISLSWHKNILFDGTPSCANLQKNFYTTCTLGCGLETMIPSFLYITSPLNVVECATSSFLWKTFTTQYAYIGILSFYLCDLRSFVNNSQNYNNLHRVLIALIACLLGMHWQWVRYIKYDLFNKWQTLHSLQKCKWWVSYML